MLLKLEILREESTTDDLYWLGEWLLKYLQSPRNKGGLEVQITDTETGPDRWYFDVQVTR